MGGEIALSTGMRAKAWTELMLKLANTSNYSVLLRLI